MKRLPLARLRPIHAVLGVAALTLAACQPAATALPATATPVSEATPTLVPTEVPPSPTAAPTLVPPTPSPEPQAPVLFDDFIYDDHAGLEANGWVVRSAPGWPGVPGATWWPEGVSFHDSDTLRYATSAGERPDRWLRLAAATDGTGAGTRQAQLCHQRKYLEGTYAARILFSDAPAFGPDGDQLVQTFYTISPLAADLDPDYSELDFEYLPNGGWGSPAHTFYFTTWETFRPEPNWLADNTSSLVTSPHGGEWHTLVLQVRDGEVRYFVDGVARGVHGDPFYPEVPMSINFNLWFIRDGQSGASTERQYEEYVDWVFHHAGVSLSPDEVEAAVAALRASGTAFIDAVPPLEPALDTPCDF